MSEREAWVWLIANAAWADTRHKVGQAMVDVPRGSLMATLRELQSVWMWGSDTKVRNFLKRLENERMIRCEVKAHGNAQKTQITVCNYSQFQSAERTRNADGNAPETHRKRTKETIEQDNNTEAKASSSKRGSRLPDDWFLPASWGQWAVSEGYSEAVIRRESENFRDYWHSKAGPSASKLDWEATWRVWMRKAPKGQQNGNGTFNGSSEASGDRQLRLIALAARSL